MKPTKILAENFKAQDFTHDLKPVTLFTGPNESGKTARLDAIKVALLGYHPAVGKQPSATLAFAGESRTEMTVHLEFDTGAFITRTFKRKADGDVTRSNKGEFPAIPPVLFDASDYLEDTAAGRIKTVFERIDVSQIVISDEELLERLGKIEAVPAAESVKAVAEMIEQVKKLITRRSALKQTPQAFLEESVKSLTDLMKGEKSLFENASAQMQTLRPTGTPPKSLEKEIFAEREKLAALEKSKADLVAALNNFLKTSSRREALKALLAKSPPAIQTLEAEQTRLQALTEGHSSTYKDLYRQQETLLKEVQKHTSDAHALKTELSQLKTKVVELEGKPKCPYCKSSRQGWKEEYKIELTSTIDQKKAILTDYKNQIEALNERVKALTADMEAAQVRDRDVERTRTQLVDIKNQLVLARKEVTDRAAAEGELTGLLQITRPSEDELGGINTALDSQKRVLIDLEAKEQAFTAAQSSLVRFREMESKLIGHQVRVEVYKQAAKLVTDIQKEIVAKAFDSILAPARKFTDGIIDGKLDYQNDELGYHSEAGWVSHKVMSGRGKDLAYLGLQVALAQQSPVKVLLMDEFSDFDQPTKLKVIERMLALTEEGFIDCFVGADPRSEDFFSIENPRFQHVVLGHQEAEKK